MSTEDSSALPAIQWILIVIMAFMLISYKAESVQLRKDLDDLRIKCEQLEAENGR